MRTLVDLPDEALHDLNEVAKAQKVSRAEVIRCSIRLYLQEHKARNGKSGIDAAFGALKGKLPDGLEFQERMRSEWEDRT